MGGEYTVCLAVLSAALCTDTMCRMLTVDDASVHVPNAFTPDEDEHNGAFGPVFAGALPEQFRFEIFDRWGQSIFVSEEHGKNWNGRFEGGGEVPIGVYVWKLWVWGELPTARYERIGHVTLLR